MYIMLNNHYNNKSQHLRDSHFALKCNNAYVKRNSLFILQFHIYTKRGRSCCIPLKAELVSS